MSVEDILDMLEDILDKSWNLPMSGGRCVVDAEKVHQLVYDIRANLPDEIRQARAIAKDRADIISTAQREAEAIVRKAEDRARALIAQEEVLRQAQSKATEILSQAQTKSREMRQASQDFSDDMLKQAEEALIRSVNDVKQTRQALKGAQRQFVNAQPGKQLPTAQAPKQS